MKKSKSRSLAQSTLRSIATNVLGMTGATALMLVGLQVPAAAQLGRQQGLLEPNIAADSQFQRLKLSAHAVHLIGEAKPILSAVVLDSILDAAGVNAGDRRELYKSMFVHVDLNRGTDAEFNLIPGMTAQTLTAIKAGRPWATFAAFQTAMGKTMKPGDVAALEQYLFIPIELNTFTEPLMDTFAPIGVGTRRWKHEFAEYRPWTSEAQFPARDRQVRAREPEGSGPPLALRHHQVRG